jgi:AccI restriction endonuclease
MATRQRQRDEGNSTGRETPSFTVKVEDLVIVYRWIERNKVSQAYCQVFFDSIFAINFLEIFSAIARGEDFTIETPAKSQEKATIMIPITEGLKVGKGTSPPTFAAEHRVTTLGRHDAYVVPQGGGFVLDPANMRQVLKIQD